MSEHADDAGLEEVTQFLLRPESYPADHFPPGKPRRVELVETHISRVFFAGDYVYKLKKPVKFEFLDFSTLDRRREACRDEVRLNRRMDFGTCRGVVPIDRLPDGSLILLGSFEPDAPSFESAYDYYSDAVEWLVVMHRLPAERMLDRMIEADTLTDDHVAELAKHLGIYYAGRMPVERSVDEYRAAVLNHVRGNLADLLDSAPAAERGRIAKIHAAQLQLLVRTRVLFDARVKAGRVIDGHGDLRPEHICLESPPVVYDCVEFSAEFRRIDVADELTFLEMECAKLGRRDVGQAVFDAYVAASGDQVPDALRAFYESYRACVRAKVAALRLKQLSADENAGALAELRRDLDLAEATLPRFHKPTLYVMRGLSGTGKSTVAAALAELLGIEQLRTDAIRRELFGASDGSQSFGGGNYQPAQKRQVYKELLRRARQALSRGMSIVADGAFLEADALQQARDAATAADAELLVVECRCPIDTAKARIAARLAEGRDPSEARPEIVDQQAATACELSSDMAVVEIDTTKKDLGKQLAEVLGTS
ncbi:MAG: AAA family ATPase [Planctomycetales bacterium]|nr:AAA family ATPase [Planctomycetales bacterium]MBN8624181.1 AAA family ATPase [Planctomycetota bacterium]